MKRYESYKDSGVQWVGKIPSHWNVLPLKYYISFTKGRIPSETTDKCIGYPYLTMDYLRNKNDKQVVYPNNPEGLHLMNEGDILVLWDGANAGEFIKSRKGYLGSTMAKILFDEKIYDKSYFYYLLCSIEPISKEFANGTTIPHFDSKVLVDYAYPCPNLSEQQTIVSYLDFKVGRIESAITEMEQMLEDIKAYRSSIIREAVTKGLDKNAEMKDSGIEWCSKIPKHWTISKLKNISKVSTGTTPSTSIERYWNNPTENWYTPSDFNDGDIYLTSSYRKVSVEAYNEVACKVFKKGVVLVVGIGATLGKVGISKGICSANQQINAIEFDDRILPVFGAYYLSSLKDVMKSVANSATLDIMNQSITGDLPLIYPPIEEQASIITYLDNKTSMIKRSIDEILSQITDLKAYKSSIITEAVTGKMDLRGWKPNNNV